MTTTTTTITKLPMATQGEGNDWCAPIDKHSWAFWSWALQLPGGICETSDTCIYSEYPSPEFNPGPRSRRVLPHANEFPRWHRRLAEMQLQKVTAVLTMSRHEFIRHPIIPRQSTGASAGTAGKIACDVARSSMWVLRKCAVAVSWM